MLRDFLNLRTFVRVTGGHRFACRAPTVGAVVRFILLFDAEILGCYRAFMKRDNADPSTALSAFYPVFAEKNKGDTLAECLVECVELIGGDECSCREILSMNSQVMLDVLGAVMSLTDTARVFASFHVDDAFAGRPTSSDDDDRGYERAILRVAERFHIDPVSIEGWRYEMWLDVGEILFGASAVSAPKLMTDASDMPGVVMEVVNG